MNSNMCFKAASQRYSSKANIGNCVSERFVNISWKDLNTIHIHLPLREIFVIFVKHRHILTQALIKPEGLGEIIRQQFIN